MEGWNPSGSRTPHVVARVTVVERLTLLGAVRRYLGDPIFDAIIATGLFIVAANVYDHWLNKPGTWQERPEPRRATPQSPGIEKLPD